MLEWHSGKPKGFDKYLSERNEGDIMWCEEQDIDESGKIICLAHLAEARVFDCPYRSKAEREIAYHPCSDYKTRCQNE